MYSKEDRERILTDFRESGMPLATFCRLPGKPSRNSLRSWRDAADRGELDVPAREVRGRCEHARHKAYPEETKREALRLLARGMRPADVARRLGVASGGAVASWARKRGRMPPKEAVPMADEDARARIARLEVRDLPRRRQDGVRHNRWVRKATLLCGLGGSRFCRSSFGDMFVINACLPVF